jgi:acyl-homoserine-lactone acylase
MRRLPLHRPAFLILCSALASGCADEGSSSGAPATAADSGADAVADGAIADGAIADASDTTDDATDGSLPDIPLGTPGSYEATIRRTAFGVPHITAASLRDLGFGQGYAFAQDGVCILADQLVRAQGRRSEVFGPGKGDTNITSDFAMLTLGVYEQAPAALDALPPDSRALIEGYTAGYNRYLEDVGPADLPEPCKGAAWIEPATPRDLMAYYLMLGLYGSGSAIASMIGSAQPPGATNNAAPASVIELPDFRNQPMGSNGWGIGADKSASGHGMVAVNPHFPWEGERKFSEVHLTIPGALNVYGAAIMGAPAVQIGFNEHVAWTHTVSTSNHLTLYKLTLKEGDPTTYLLDGEPVAMDARPFTIKVKQEDGTLKDKTRTMYRSHHGPVLNVPGVGWSATQVAAYRDANEGNARLIPQWLAMNRARSVPELQAALGEVHGIPWVNTMAADRDGNALYADACAVPNLSDEAIAAWKQSLTTDFFAGLAYTSGIVLLDGGKSMNDWVDDPGAGAPGLISFARSPQLVRRDFVANANDSHWLSNPAAPLEGYSPLFGDERTPRSTRTRMNLTMLTEKREGGASGADGRFTLEELQGAMLNNRALVEELIREDVLARCKGSVDVDGAAVDLTEACAVLAAWDGRLHVDSKGAVLWRELLGSFAGSDFTDAGAVFETPWSVDDPVGTPRDLVPAPKSGPDPILVALGKAVLRLEGLEVPLDVALGDMQFTRKGDEIIPIPGGTGSPEGVFNVVATSNGNGTLYPSMPAGAVVNGATGLTKEGYPIRYGSSIMIAIELGADGPRARALLTYSQSSDPASPHFADQTRRFSEGEWRDVLFTEAAIAADPTLTETTVSTE